MPSQFLQREAGHDSCGDIGGTKAMPLLAHVHQGAVEAVFEKRYPVKRRRLTIVNALPPSVTMLFNR